MSKRKKKRALLIERDALKRRLAESEERCELLMERIVALTKEYDSALREKNDFARKLSQQQRLYARMLRKIRRWQLYTAAAWLAALLFAIAVTV